MTNTDWLVHNSWMPLDPEDDNWPFTPKKKWRALPSRRLSPRMQQMLDYIDKLGGVLPVGQVILMSPSSHRTLAGLITRAYVRQDSNCDIVVLPRDMDQRRNREGAVLHIPDLDNL